MPLLAGTQLPTPGGGGGGGGPGTPVSDRQPKRVTWTSPAGDVLDLSSDAQGYRTLPGRAGFGLPPREVVYDPSPTGGGIFRTIQDQVRLLSVPLRVQADTRDDYLTRLHRLQTAMRHRYGGQDIPGVITAYLPSGSWRSIRAFYNGGLDDHTEDLEDLLFTSQPFPNLEFIALDPYWTGGTVAGAWRSTSGKAWFGAFPRTLAASQVLGAVRVDVPGDADAYPIWTIKGPGVPTIANVTTGRSFQFKSGSPIASGQTVTIDTREEQLSVVDQDGTNLYGSLQQWPDLWTLEPGPNDLTVDMASATLATRVSFTAGVRWQAGW